MTDMNWPDALERTESLATIAQRHSTGQMGWGDKTGYHNYIQFYEEHLPANVRYLLEIGVSRGHSMTMWAEMFPNAEILGLDIEVREEAIERCTDNDRITLWECNATRPFRGQRSLAALPYDVVIDDGSHQLEDQLAALILWWPSVRPGGRYFIEDIQGDNDLYVLKHYLCSERIPYHLYDGRGPGMPPDELMLVLYK